MEKIEKKLSQLLTDVFPKNDYQVVAGKIDGCMISSLVYDSRAVKPGSLYFAWPGVHVHGNSYIAKAVKAGASAVVFQDDLPEDVTRELEVLRSGAGSGADSGVKLDVPLIKVADSRFAMAPFAAAFYDNPSKKMAVIGVTGTEGKSTTVFLIWQFLRLCGKKAGFFSTVQYSLGGDAVNNPEHQTTPEATVVQEKLYQMAANGCEYAVVESSSHGLSKKLNRLGSVCFDVGIMMNVTSEHLEFHGTYEQYKSDKANLFRALDECDHVKTILGKKVEVPSFGIVKAVDPAAEYFADCTNKAVYGFAMETDVAGGAGRNGGANDAQSAAGIGRAQADAGCAQSASGVPAEIAHFADGKLAGVFMADGIKSDSEGELFNLHGNCAAGTDKAGGTSGAVSVQDENEAVRAEKTGVTFYVDNCCSIENIRINLPGTFNVYNATTAMLAVSGILGVPVASLKAATAKLLPVKGRMTVVDCGQPFEVIVDYAHTPSSFMTIFPPLRERLEREAAEKRGRLIALFGSGGERDTKKRPEQGRIAAEYCDIVILADEDPRGEDPMALLEDIAAGCKNSRRNENLFLIPDRPTAIAKAFSLAAPGDIVLLLGKAHENSIIYKDYVMPYDEISEAKNQLGKLGWQ